MLNKAKTSRSRSRPRPRPELRGRGQFLEIEAKAEAKNNYEKVLMIINIRFKIIAGKINKNSRFLPEKCPIT